MKIGDKVVCVDRNEYLDYLTIENVLLLQKLELNKIYNICNVNINLLDYICLSELEQYGFFKIERFILLSDYRKLKLVKLNENNDMLF